MDKIDYKKQYKQLYQPPMKPVVVEVPSFKYLMIDGSGDPNTSKEAKDAIEALFPVAYTLKFTVKKQKSFDYAVMPLEGLWWTDDMSEFDINNKNIWKFTYMIMHPDFIDINMVKQTCKEVSAKKNLPAINKIRFEPLHEKSSVQIMHIGPFSEEGPAIQKIHDMIKAVGGTFDGTVQKHHEIYLSDYRKTAPERLKTIIRQPFVK
jgi:hypothetical protein